jgi:hypothetical protein
MKHIRTQNETILLKLKFETFLLWLMVITYKVLMQVLYIRPLNVNSLINTC